MLAYHNKPALKTAVLRQIRAHERADRIIQGTYVKWGARYEFVGGCAVGCSLESLRRIEHLDQIEHDDHALYERYLGVPAALAYLEDCIFEGLPEAEALTWPRRFAQAIRPGADLSMVGPCFLRALLAEPGAVQAGVACWPAIQSAVEGVVTLFDEWIRTGVKPPIEAWQQAHRAAADAADAADTTAAGEAAHAAALAADAADSADATAAADAADAATAAAYADAAYSAEHRRQADLLVRLLGEAPMGAGS